MILYRFSICYRDHDPGYVVAGSYDQAESLIRRKYEYSKITKIERVADSIILPADHETKGGGE